MKILERSADYPLPKILVGTCVCGKCKSKLLVSSKDFRRYFGPNLDWHSDWPFPRIDAATFSCPVCEAYNLLEDTESMVAGVLPMANHPDCKGVCISGWAEVVDNND